MSPIDSELYLLKWNNFGDNLASGFIDLLQEEAMVDVTLAVEGRLIQAHKVVLSVCSSYFRKMFEVNPCQHPIVILKDVGYQELTDMLDFMYRGEVNVKHKDLLSFFKLAETLKVKALSGICGSESPTDQNFMKHLPILNRKYSDIMDCTSDFNSQIQRFSIIPTVGPISPIRAVNSKMNIRKDKHETKDKFDKNTRRKCSYMNDIDCTYVMEDMCDTSFESHGDENQGNKSQNNKLLPGPSRMNKFPEVVPAVGEIGGNEMPENRSLPGPSRREELCEWVPPESISSRKASKPLSLIWSFFHFDCDENKSECKLCGKVFKACPKTGTASVKYHLHFAHHIHRHEGECKYVE